MKQTTRRTILSVRSSVSARLSTDTLTLVRFREKHFGESLHRVGVEHMAESWRSGYYHCHPLCFLVIEVDDMAKYYDEMLTKGVQMTYADGTPIPENEKCFVLEPYGIKAAYFPKDVSQGMTIEVTQRGPRDTCLLHKRDDSWS